MCVKLPEPPVPSLPSPLTLGVGVATPPLGVNATLCCKYSAFSLPPLTIIPPIPAAVAAPLVGFLASMRTFINGFQPRCPKN